LAVPLPLGGGLHLVLQVVGELVAHLLDVGAGVRQDPGGLRVEGQGGEHMLEARVFMAQPAALGDRDGERDLKVLRELHASSSLPSSSGSAMSFKGMPFARASSVTSTTLVSATSRE